MKKIIILSAVAVSLVIIWSGYSFLFADKEDAGGKAGATGKNKELDRTYTLKRGDLVIGLIQSGSVNAKKKHKLSLQANFRTKLVWVIDENVKVKKGDVLAKFETDELKEKIADLKISYETLGKELMVAQETEKIQLSSNKAEINIAEDRLVQAEDARKKYLKFERSKKRDGLDLTIRQADAAYNNAVDDYNKERQKIAREGNSDKDKELKNQLQLMALQNKINSTKNSLDNAETAMKLFKRYDHPSRMTKLNNDCDNCDLNLRKVKISTASKMIQKKKQIDNYILRIKKVKTRMDKYISYVDMMQLVAPVDGVVIYGNPDRRRGNVDIKLGMDIWKRLILMTIPEMENLIVEFDLPEQYRSKVKKGDKVIITPDSLATLKLSGKINKIATLPVNIIFWDRASPKIYKSSIVLDKQDKRLVSGMSVQLEIVTRVIKNTLFVPVEAIFEKNDNFFVYQSKSGTPKEVEVKIGESTDNYVRILDGLEEGDTVFLYRPYQKKGGM
ncbi:MAG: HlyD family efflux transporter periplasmic adaptor subunit [Victivallaceae bacterium]|nr:HlyD family efflux transporter periplasmic adaptor subunit [Victivallaceae bacterium]